MSEITAEMAVTRKELAQCAEELRHIREDEGQEKWIRATQFAAAKAVFKRCWKDKPTEKLINKVSYMLALINLIDEELERRQNNE